MSNVVDLFAERRKREVKEKLDLLKRVHEGNAAAPDNNKIEESTIDQSLQDGQPRQTIDQNTSSQNISNESFDFEHISKQNKLRQARLQKERLHSNESVKRSYKLTPTKPSEPKK